MPADRSSRIMERIEIAHLLEGVRLLGTGGGGDPRRGEAQIEADLERGRTYQLVDPSAVPDDALVASGGFMGHMTVKESWSETIEHWETTYELEEAVRAMERHVGRSIDYLVPFELGGGNTIAILSCAARMGIPVVDGDGIGRAAPETQMCSFAAHGISLMPMTVYEEHGGSVVIETGDLYFADDVGRFIVTRCGGLVANCHYPMSGSQLRMAVVPQTLSEAARVGERITHAVNATNDPVEAAADALNARIHLRGWVTALTERTEGGFFFSEVEVSDREGHSMTLRVKNEVMAGWLNGQLISVFPDHLYLMDPTKGVGLLTRDLNPGIEVAVLGRPCHQVVREVVESESARKAFSPQRFGLSEEYHPTEELLAGAMGRQGTREE